MLKCPTETTFVYRSRKRRHKLCVKLCQTRTAQRFKQLLNEIKCDKLYCEATIKVKIYLKTNQLR